MAQRIILFRGMNTGGVRAPVSELRAMAAEMGLGHPRTLLASGNLVVESDAAPSDLEAAVEAAMARTFGLKIVAMARTPAQWAELIAANPFAEQASAEPSKALAMVMKAGIADGALEACRALAEGGEAVEARDFGQGGAVLYFWFPNGQGQSGVFRKATPRMLGMGTGRNWNTVTKLAEMAGAETN